MKKIICLLLVVSFCLFITQPLFAENDVKSYKKHWKGLSLMMLGLTISHYGIVSDEKTEENQNFPARLGLITYGYFTYYCYSKILNANKVENPKYNKLQTYLSIPIAIIILQESYRPKSYKPSDSAKSIINLGKVISILGTYYVLTASSHKKEAKQNAISPQLYFAYNRFGVVPMIGLNASF